MADPGTEGGVTLSPGKLIEAVFGFFHSVLESIAADDLLRVLWGVEVLLLLVLFVMLRLGGLSDEHRFALTLVIVGSMVLIFLATAWRHQSRKDPRHLEPTESLLPHGQPSTQADPLAGSVETCIDLLRQIHAANARIVVRGRATTGPWARLMTETYGNICRDCHERRLRGAPPNDYLDVICAEPDVDTVCRSKWLLGEKLDDYRRHLNRMSPPPREHDDLEILIRRSVTQPDWSPPELDRVVGQAIQAAEQLLA